MPGAGRRDRVNFKTEVMHSIRLRNAGWSLRYRRWRPVLWGVKGGRYQVGGELDRAIQATYLGVDESAPRPWWLPE